MKKFSLFLLIISIFFSFISCQDESDGSKSFTVLKPVSDSLYGYEVSDVSLCITKAIKDSGENFTFSSTIGTSFNADNLGSGRYLIKSYAYDSLGTLIASTEDFKISTDRTDSFSYDLQLLWNETEKPEGKYCVIKFNTNGGSEIESLKVLSGEYVLQPADPSKRARIFDGWYSNSSLTKYFDFSEAVRCNLTLHAKWEMDPDAIQKFFYVSSTGSDSNGDGTQDNPYFSITRAVSEINGNADSELDYTIYISGTVTGNPSIGTLYANSLTIEGISGSDSDFIDGNNSGIALAFGSDISSDVTLKNLTVQNGAGRYGAGLRYLGSGLLTVKNCIIRDNSATGTEINADGSTSNSNGAGIVLQNGSLSLISTSVTGNYSQYNAGGIYFNGNTFSIDSASVISGNEAGYSGGGVSVTGGIFDMAGGTISSNKALKGGGIIVQSAGTLNISGGTVSQNEVYADSSTSYAGMGTGGGVLVNDGLFTMTGGLIDSNTSESNGAGVFINKGTVSMSGGTISNNSTVNGSGGGVYADQGIFIMSGGSISENISAAHGGGVFVDRRTNTDTATYEPGKFYMNGGIISSNTAGVSGEKSGGGVDVKGIFELSGGTISSNTAGYAAGVWNTDTGVFTMTGGCIEQNVSSGNGGGLGAQGITDLQGGDIQNNTAANRGGGIFAAANVNAGGTAVVAGGSSGANDIFLKSGVVLNFTGELTGTADSKAVIRCSQYYEGAQVFTETESGYIKLNYEKFHITESSEWSITEAGCLKRVIVLSASSTSNLTDPSVPYIIQGESGTNNSQIDIGNVTTSEDVTYYVTLDNVKRNAGSWASGLIIYNKNAGTTLTVHFTVKGENTIIGHNHSGIKLDGVSGANINVIWDTESGGSVTFGASYGSTPDYAVSNVTDSMTAASGCTFSGTADGSTYSNIDEFFSAAKTATSGSTFTLTK
ncbi:InlB B-repeat-containing protein [Treponema sp.]|uniref:InlB B-repeat-containing protein n=1 Tax=Treponema sp. TaxID=166 RepID=UPI003890731D